MSKVIDRTGKGSSINVAEFDANYDSLSGINEAQTGTTYTVTIDDQNRTLEFSNASPIAVTLTDIATISGALHTSDFKVTLKNIGAGLVTVTRGSTDTFDDASTSIELEQGEYATIQTDSTGAIWNIINDNRDVVTEDATQTLTNKTLTSPTVTSPVINTAVSGTAILDEDDMATDSATQLSTQQSIKAYVDNGAYPAFKAHRNAAYSYTAGNSVIFDTEVYDVTTDYSTSNGRFTPTVAGKYFVYARVTLGIAAGGTPYIETNKNGIASGRNYFVTTSGNVCYLEISDVIECNGATDYISIELSNSGTITNTSYQTYAFSHRVQA